jgi:hypothetical protein
MRLLIQLTFNNGLGNLYAGAIDILNFVQKYKDLGYSCELIFSLNGNAGGNKFIGNCKFEDIFDINTFQVFDRIRTFQHSIGVKTFEDYIYHSTQYGPDYPGAHWWDVFFDAIPETIFAKPVHNVHTLLTGEQKPIFLAKLNQKIYDKVNNFVSKNKIDYAIQVRHLDYVFTPNDYFKNHIDNLHKKIYESDKTFYITSNNQYTLDTLSKLENVVNYQYNYLDILPNDHSYYFYHKNISDEILLDRLYDNLAEMVILSNFDRIYFVTSFSWISSYLYYAKSHNEKQILININENINFE